MYWQDKADKKEVFVVPEDVVDVLYAIVCPSLPLDHAYALSKSLQAALPWLPDEPRAGIHMIHVAESGNGWYRPEDPQNEVLCVSRRTRLVLRLRKERLRDADALTGMTLDIDGFALQVGSGKIRPLSPLTTLYARYVQIGSHREEEPFMRQVESDLKQQGTQARKILCGKLHRTRTPAGPISSRSVMVAELNPESAVRLQEHGLGPGRQMGFGLFLPHKSVRAVREANR